MPPRWIRGAGSEGGELPAAERHELVSVHLRARAEGDEGRHLLAEGGVGNAHHRRFRHRAVSEEGGLDLPGHHGIAAAQDQVLLPPHDGDEAGGRDPREVPVLNHPSRITAWVSCSARR